MATINPTLTPYFFLWGGGGGIKDNMKLNYGISAPSLSLTPLHLLIDRLWSSGQSSWLQIRRPGFNFRHYQKKLVVGLERGPLSLMSTTEELLDSEVAAPV
jgi:hypothetical protein